MAANLVKSGYQRNGFLDITVDFELAEDFVSVKIVEGAVYKYGEAKLSIVGMERHDGMEDQLIQFLTSPRRMDALVSQPVEPLFKSGDHADGTDGKLKHIASSIETYLEAKAYTAGEIKVSGATRDGRVYDISVSSSKPLRVNKVGKLKFSGAKDAKQRKYLNALLADFKGVVANDEVLAKMKSTILATYQFSDCSVSLGNEDDQVAVRLTTQNDAPPLDEIDEDAEKLFTLMDELCNQLARKNDFEVRVELLHEGQACLLKFGSVEEEAGPTVYYSFEGFSENAVSGKLLAAGDLATFTSFCKLSPSKGGDGDYEMNLGVGCPTASGAASEVLSVKLLPTGLIKYDSRESIELTVDDSAQNGEKVFSYTKDDMKFKIVEGAAGELIRVRCGNVADFGYQAVEIRFDNISLPENLSEPSLSQFVCDLSQCGLTGFNRISRQWNEELEPLQELEKVLEKDGPQIEKAISRLLMLLGAEDGARFDPPQPSDLPQAYEMMFTVLIFYDYLFAQVPDDAWLLANHEDLVLLYTGKGEQILSSLLDRFEKDEIGPVELYAYALLFDSNDSSLTPLVAEMAEHKCKLESLTPELVWIHRDLSRLLEAGQGDFDFLLDYLPESLGIDRGDFANTKGMSIVEKFKKTRELTLWLKDASYKLSNKRVKRAGLSQSKVQLANYQRAFDMGIANGALLLGDIQRSSKLTASPKEAAKYYEAAIEAGSGMACDRLAWMYRDGELGGSADLEKVFFYSKKGAELKQLNCMEDYASFYDPSDADWIRERNAVVGGADVKKAIKSYSVAANAGSAWACNRLARIYLNGLASGEKELKSAHDWYKWGSKRGCEDSMAMYASFYDPSDEDWAKERNIVVGGADADLAIKSYKEAVDKGEKWAASRLGELYRNGPDGVEKDLKKALKWYEKAAELGHGYSTYMVATYYFPYNENWVLERNAIVGGADIAEAEAKLLKAGELGYSYSYYSLGDMHSYKALGDKSSFEKAIEYHSKAIELENDEGYSGLASAYMIWKEDYAKTFSYIEKARAAGETDYTESLYRLMLHHGNAQINPYFDPAKAVGLYKDVVADLADDREKFDYYTSKRNIANMYRLGVHPEGKNWERAQEIYLEIQDLSAMAKRWADAYPNWDGMEEDKY
ncbi:tetratricopeptide repeat protein [Persicirhabdus sediminis]|nr:hypothetical protein [Persicirhabdus sediminis]